MPTDFRALPSAPPAPVPCRLLATPAEWAGFVASLVHELRTPLGSMQVLGELLAQLAEGRPGADEGRHAKAILAVARDLQGLLADASQLARLASGGVTPQLEDLDLLGLMREAQEEVRTYGWERGVALTVSYDPALPQRLRSDPERLRKAVGLLLEVAIAHAVSEVFFRLDREEDAVRITVSNDGPALPEVGSERLFEPFHDAARVSRRAGGRSLALALTAALATVLGGRLEASNRGGRPTLDLRLPLMPKALGP